jgi:hypothetical protein
VISRSKGVARSQHVRQWQRKSSYGPWRALFVVKNPVSDGGGLWCGLWGRAQSKARQRRGCGLSGYDNSERALGWQALEGVTSIRTRKSLGMGGVAVVDLVGWLLLIQRPKLKWGFFVRLRASSQGEKRESGRG